MFTASERACANTLASSSMAEVGGVNAFLRLASHLFTIFHGGALVLDEK